MAAKRGRIVKQTNSPLINPESQLNLDNSNLGIRSARKSLIQKINVKVGYRENRLTRTKTPILA